ncbi:MAG: hypothetical protein HOO96_01325, partial [Polyangiaceae bacterium]|nr:hypothetical protein [Polyangiaceae bacterium]
MKILSLFRVVSVGALVFPILVACSSTKSTTTKKAAAGSAKAPTTKQPASSPKPTAASGGKKAGSNVTGNRKAFARPRVTAWPSLVARAPVESLVERARSGVRGGAGGAM